MPIRFSGSARPRKLKSPDPINMPSVRENIVPRIKAEVAYYKENGEMPSVEQKWQTTEETFTHPSIMANSQFEIHDGYLYVNNGTENAIQSYDLSTGSLVSTISQNNNNVSAIWVGDNAKMLYGSANSGGTAEGRIVSLPIDTSTGTLTNTKTVWTSASGRSYIYDGRAIAVMDELGLAFTAGEGYYSGEPRQGLVTCRNFSDGSVNTNFTWDLSNLGSIRTSHNIIGSTLNATNDDWRLGRSMARDSSRLAITCGGQKISTDSIKRAGFILVLDVSATGAVEIQRIANPTPSNTSYVGNIDGVAMYNDKMYMVVNSGSPADDYDENMFSVVVYSWNGSAYVQEEWYTVPLDVSTTTKNSPKSYEDEVLYFATDNGITKVSRG